MARQAGGNPGLATAFTVVGWNLLLAGGMLSVVAVIQHDSKSEKTLGLGVSVMLFSLLMFGLGAIIARLHWKEHDTRDETGLAHDFIYAPQ